MNRRQIEVQQISAADEERVIRLLKQVYGQASKDCAARIQELSMRTDMENLQSIVYQKQYQQAMQKQIEGVLNELNSRSFTTIADYLGQCYETGFFGTLYDLQGQGIPLCFPINQEEVVQALQVDSKISQGLYQRMGEDVDHLRRSIKAELSRGVSNGSSWNQIAGKIALGMNGPFDKAYNRAVNIARTEGHRVQQESTLHCQQRAKAKGADVVKQWDSTLDGVTRPTHIELDGQVREVEEPFEVAGKKAMFPGGFSDPSEDCNCRCCLLQRARWALSKEEFFDKWDGDKNELVKIPAKSYNEFKEEVKETLQLQEVINNNPTLKTFTEHLDKLGVEYRQVSEHAKALTESEIIEALAGGDRTKGSCASVGLAYVGQKNGLNVLDFRGGESQNFFSTGYNLRRIAQFPNITVISETARASATAGKHLLTHVEAGKEYYFVCGRHAAIVRRTDEGVLQYLELQSESRSGWTNFNGNPRYTLANRFGATQTGRDFEAYMFDVADANGSKDLQALLGYINTGVDDQQKGVGGSVK